MKPRHLSATSSNTGNNDTCNVRRGAVSIGFQTVFVQRYQQRGGHGRRKAHFTTNRTILFRVNEKNKFLPQSNGYKDFLLIREYKDKIEIVDYKAEDTMEYDYRNTYHYKPEQNGPGLTGNEIVTVAHPLILALLLAINVDRAELLPFIQTAMNGLLHNPTDIFFTGRVWDLLYDGIELDCSSDAFEVTAVCSEFDSGDYGEIRRFNETTFKFSLFGNVNFESRNIFVNFMIIFVHKLQTNGSSIGRFKVFRGKKNIRDLGRVLEYNGATEMDAWYEDECNQINGTDGTIFPPFYEKEEGYTIFIPQMCRSLTAEYQRPSKYAGIKTNHYTLSFDVSKYGPANCYCRDHEQCPPEGMLDLFPCIGSPIAISAPHFYQGYFPII